MNQARDDRFEILSRLATAGASGIDLKQVSESTLAMAAKYVGLSAAALYLWDDNQKVTLAVDYALSDAGKEHLASLENDLFRDLRKKKNLLAAILSFDGDPKLHSFTLPLTCRGKTFGAVVGLQKGEMTIISQNFFLESLAALFAISYAVDMLPKADPETAKKLEDIRTRAIIETAVTVNHEINNPLTAILGNVQLLLLREGELTRDLRDKLKVVEQSALKIRDVTQKLMRFSNARTIKYTDGTNMIDLSDDSSDDSPDKDSENLPKKP